VKNRHGIDACNNCHRPTARAASFVFANGSDHSCSPECDADLFDLFDAAVENDGEKIAEIYTRGRSVECSCIAWCRHCDLPAKVARGVS
jgi:hypothetical protein